MNDAWINDLKLLIKDIGYFIRDVINDGSHLIIRAIKVFTAISVWKNDLGLILEDYLKSLRELLNMKK
jgi:hypothetical protein